MIAETYEPPRVQFVQETSAFKADPVLQLRVSWFGIEGCPKLNHPLDHFEVGSILHQQCEERSFGLWLRMGLSTKNTGLKLGGLGLCDQDAEDICDSLSMLNF